MGYPQIQAVQPLHHARKRRSKSGQDDSRRSGAVLRGGRPSWWTSEKLGLR